MAPELPREIHDKIAEHLYLDAADPHEAARQNIDLRLSNKSFGVSVLSPNVAALDADGRLANEVYDKVIPEHGFPDPGPPPALPADLLAEIEHLDPWDYTAEQNRRLFEAQGGWNPAAHHFLIYAANPLQKFISEPKQVKLVEMIREIPIGSGRAGTLAALSQQVDDLKPKARTALTDGAIDILAQHPDDHRDHHGSFAMNVILRARNDLTDDQTSRINGIVAHQRSRELFPGSYSRRFPKDRSLKDSLDQLYKSYGWDQPSAAAAGVSPDDRRSVKSIAELRAEFDKTCEIQPEEARITAFGKFARTLSGSHAGREAGLADAMYGEAPGDHWERRGYLNAAPAQSSENADRAALRETTRSRGGRV